MDFIKPLPDHLVKRFTNWKRETHDTRLGHYETLASHGQHPREMIISCCDSRVHVTQIFQADTGEMFVHRNVAALVPPFRTDTQHRCTSAAVEYAVRVLKVERILVLGHSQCGGVKGCLDMCEGRAPELLADESFIGRWVDLLRPGYERIAKTDEVSDRLTLLEKEAVLVSLENLMTFPWISEAVGAGSLQLHGLWTDIATGTMEAWFPDERAFAPL